MDVFQTTSVPHNTVPLPKCNVGSKALKVEDFRGISISPILSKLFEYCVLDRYEFIFTSSDSQFGFKKGLGCSQIIYAVKSTVNYYANLGTTVNLCALDIKKAFDKVNHYGLLIKLMDKLILNGLLRVLEHWFTISVTCVRWGNVYSNFFQLDCGVRQGGVLSPHLFAVYIDDVVSALQRSAVILS